jgi:hypothetical protein
MHLRCRTPIQSTESLVFSFQYLTLGEAADARAALGHIALSEGFCSLCQFSLALFAVIKTVNLSRLSVRTVTYGLRQQP